MPNLLRGLSHSRLAGEDHSLVLAGILGGVSPNVPSFAGLESHRAECLSLGRERNPEIFYEGLLQLGQRLDGENRPEAAARIYAGLAEGGAAPAEIRQRARERLAALTGSAPSSFRAESLLRRLARDTMEPTALAGLTVASAAFRLTRLAVLTRLAGTPATLFTRGFGAQAMAGLMGFGVEATVFPFAVRGAALALGRPLDWSPERLGTEVASSFLILGAMKLTGWAASRPLAPRGAAFRQQAGMLTGILLGHHLETAAGLRPRQDGATSLVDSLALLLQFNAAGRLAQGIMGEGFRAWELDLDARARFVRGTPLPGPLPQGERGLEAVFGTGFGSKVFRPRELLPLSAMMSGSGEGSGGKRPPRREPTLPFITAIKPLAEEGAVAEGADPLVVDLFPQILRRMKEGGLDFRGKLQRENVQFRFTEAFPEDLERHLKGIQDFLEQLAGEMAGAEGNPSKIPFARRVTILSTVTGQRVVFLKTLLGGFDRLITSNPMASEDPVPEAFPTPPPPATRTPVVSKAPEPPLTDMPESDRSAGEGPLPTPLVTDLDRLSLMIRTGVLGRTSGELVFIVEGTEVTLRHLQKLGEDLGSSLRPEIALRVFSSKEDKTFSAFVEGNRVLWQEVQDASWERLRSQRVFNRLVLRTPDEIYRQILIYSREASRSPQAEAVFRLKSAPESMDTFVPFVTRALNLYRMSGKSVSVELDGGGSALRWENLENEWKAAAAPAPAAEDAPDLAVRRGASGPLRASPPPPLPAADTPSASDHFSQVREILRRKRSRESLLPGVPVRIPNASEESATGETVWHTAMNGRQLREILSRPASSRSLEDIVNIRVTLRDGLNEAEFESLKTYVGVQFPANRVAYLYDVKSQRVYRLARPGDSLEIEAVALDDE